jgi:hypothetical protein
MVAYSFEANSIYGVLVTNVKSNDLIVKIACENPRNHFIKTSSYPEWSIVTALQIMVSIL